MPVKFPRMHIAESVVNRILNAADDIKRSNPVGVQAPEPSPEPEVPYSAEQSYQLDQALMQPPPENLPGIDEAPDPGATASGDALLDTLLQPAE